MTTNKRHFLNKGMGHLSTSGIQVRFVIFFLVVLITYTFILLIFRKLAEILQFPLFFPIALSLLAIFIGVVATLYSHNFVGPLIRIRKAIDVLAEGDTSVTLRLRETDDPMLKDLVGSINRLCEHNRNAHALIGEAAEDLSRAVAEITRALAAGESGDKLRPHADLVRERQRALDQALGVLNKR